MRYELLRAEAQNKLYIDFTTDSVMRQVVQYYDRRGSRNERLKAHYLLGCCYRDMHEAPVALLTWEDAVAAADTTAADCDYATLFRIYGQMAEIYFRQFMPEKELAVREKLCRNALLAGDTLNYIRGLLLRNDAYLALGDTAIVFENIEYVRQLYLERGLTQQAAQVYPSAIQLALIKQQFERADSMMQVFERESGLFDEAGNIGHSREIYYYFKGMYYLGVNRMDSAEHWFRKALTIKGLELKAYHGLMSLYKFSGEIDSTYKYSSFYDKSLVDNMSQTKTAAIAQAQGMYDYHRQQKIAEQEHRKRLRITSLLVAFCLLVASATLYAMRRRWKKAEAMRKLELAFAQKEEDLDNTKAELRYVKSHLQDIEDATQLVSNMEERIHRLEQQLRHDAQILGTLDIIEREERLMNDEAVKQIQRICHPYNEDCEGDTVKKPSRKALKKEWEALRKAIKREHLSCYIAVEGSETLTPQEKEVALLSRIDLQTQEMATIIGCSSQSISNARAGISEKLFSSNETFRVNKKLKEL